MVVGGMSEHIEKLRAVVRELEDELHALEDVDQQAREVLQEALQEIQVVLRRQQSDSLEATELDQEQIGEQPDSESVMDQLRESAYEFEGSHPTFSGVLMRLVDGLGQMGI